MPLAPITTSMSPLSCAQFLLTLNERQYGLLVTAPSTFGLAAVVRALQQINWTGAWQSSARVPLPPASSSTYVTDGPVHRISRGRVVTSTPKPHPWLITSWSWNHIASGDLADHISKNFLESRPGTDRMPPHINLQKLSFYYFFFILHYT